MFILWKIIIQDYEFIEDELRSSFHPQNSFCFAIDKKSPLAFQNKIRQLSKCFPNVYSSPGNEQFTLLF